MSETTDNESDKTNIKSTKQEPDDDSELQVTDAILHWLSAKCKEEQELPDGRDAVKNEEVLPDTSQTLITDFQNQIFPKKQNKSTEKRFSCDLRPNRFRHTTSRSSSLLDTSSPEPVRKKAKSVNQLEELFSDDEDEDWVELMSICSTARQQKIFRERTNHWQVWKDDAFFQIFRLSKGTVWKLFKVIEDSIKSKTNRNNAVAADVKLLLTLRYYSTGNIARACADFCGVSQSTAGQIVHLVSHNIALLAPRYIKMPNNSDADSVMAEFKQKYGFPRCLGAIDCTHVKISLPDESKAEIFRNRKGYYSLNVQTVSDASLRYRNVVARWQGSIHDATIFEHSNLRRQLERGDFPGVLVGDEAYPNKSYLLRKLPYPSNEAELMYNECLTQSRNVVERSYRVWKTRFPILVKGINVRLPLVEAIIISTAVLHNIAVNAGEKVPDVDEETLSLINEPNTTDYVVFDEPGEVTARYLNYFHQCVSRKQMAA